MTTRSQKPLMSVVVPMYDAVTTIGATLRSLAAQDYAPLEIIVVDDGSTDGSPEAARKVIEASGLRDRAHIIIKENGGPASARNLGIEHTSPESGRVMFVDSDDIVSPTYVSNMARYADRTGCLIISRLRHCSEREAIEAVRHIDLTETNTDRYIAPLDNPNFLARLREGIMGSACTKCYSLDIIRRHSLRFEPGLPEDARFNFEYLRRCDEVVITDRTDYFYISREGSVTTLPRPELAGNYIRLGTDLIAAVRQGFESDIYAFLYPQFRAIADKYVGSGHLAEASALMKVPLVRRVMTSYRPASAGDALAHLLLKHRLFRLYRLLVR